MTEFKIKSEYSQTKKVKFFKDKEPKEYHYFSVDNPEVIPDEYLYFAKEKNQPYWIVVADSLVKKIKSDLCNLEKEYKFIINLGGNRTAKFNTNNRNWMVLKAKDYWENTVQKIGFWDNENYFYEVNKQQYKNNNQSQSESNKKSFWKKVAWICLPILLFFVCLVLLIKWISKEQK